MRSSALRKHRRTIGAMIVTLLIALLPHIVWRLRTARTLAAVIVDKTVPFENYREHAAIPWILHAMKLRAPNGRFLDPARDYLGFDPKAKVGRDLAAADVTSADVLVITDTYGVYRGDYEREGDIAALERSPKIYGGLTDDEAGVVESFVARGGAVVAEFNTFGSPTSDSARTRAEGVFGARWTKWVARHWPDLQDKNEVPAWVGRVWERVTHTPFTAKGGGLVFVREDEDIVVLLDQEDLGEPVITQERTARGAALGLPPSATYAYWLDVLEATDGEVLYEHVVAATASGTKKLADHKLAPRFPALLKRGDAWYFAGDFVDNVLDLGSPELAGAMTWHGFATGCAGSSPDEASFWRFYVPIMARIFASRAR